MSDQDDQIGAVSSSASSWRESEEDSSSSASADESLLQTPPRSFVTTRTTAAFTTDTLDSSFSSSSSGVDSYSSSSEDAASHSDDGPLSESEGVPFGGGAANLRRSILLPGRDPAALALERARRAEQEEAQKARLRGSFAAKRASRNSMQPAQRNASQSGAQPQVPFQGAWASPSFMQHPPYGVSHLFAGATPSYPAGGVGGSSAARVLPLTAANLVRLESESESDSSCSCSSSSPGSGRWCSCTGSITSRSDSDSDYSICSCSLATDSSSEFGTDCSDCSESEVQLNRHISDALDSFGSSMTALLGVGTNYVANLLASAILRRVLGTVGLPGDLLMPLLLPLTGIDPLRVYRKTNTDATTTTITPETTQIEEATLDTAAL